MRVLVACETSGRVRDAFARRGHDAWSCDLLPSKTPGQHIQGDALEVIGNGWDLLVAHPPCRFLSRAGARWVYRGGTIDESRVTAGVRARVFFDRMLHAPVPRVAVENPTPLRLFALPEPTQAIEPYQFGHPYSKRTLLWLRGLPPLAPTDVLDEHKPFLPSNTGEGRRKGQRSSTGGVRDAREAAVTFQGIAEAMADQWG